jgi:hypothetical protein
LSAKIQVTLSCFLMISRWAPSSETSRSVATPSSTRVQRLDRVFHALEQKPGIVLASRRDGRRGQDADHG